MNYTTLDDRDGAHCREEELVLPELLCDFYCVLMMVKCWIGKNVFSICENVVSVERQSGRRVDDGMSDDVWNCQCRLYGGRGRDYRGIEKTLLLLADCF